MADHVWLIEAKAGPKNGLPEGEWLPLVGDCQAGALTEQNAKRMCLIFRNSRMGAALFRDGMYTDLRIRKYTATDECSPA